MKTIVTPIIISFLFALLVSCTSYTSTPAMIPTDVEETQTVLPTRTPLLETELALITPTDISNPTAIPSPSPDQQVYADPQGWYVVFFPADMEPTDKPNVFSRLGDFFETGYLPEMRYMSNVINVCAWLANIELEPEQSEVDWGFMLSPTFQSEPRCSVSSQGSVETTQYDIFEIPAADPEHRFVYLKTSWAFFNAMNGNKRPTATISWLKPIIPRQEPILAPLSDQELSLWKEIAPLLEDVSVTEYALPPGSDPGEQSQLMKELPREALPDWYRKSSNIPVPTATLTVQEQLKSLGYEFKLISQLDPYRQQLLRDGRVLFDHVYKVSEVYRYSTDSGPLTAFVVYTVNFNKFLSPQEFHSFLVQNDAIYPWEYNHQDPPYVNPVLYQNEILWLKTTKDFRNVQLRKSNQMVVYSFAVFTEPIYAVNRFTTWNGHWVLAARDFLIQDGEILNETLGFEEIFSWALVADRPMFLFRKGPRIGVSYDGQILPLRYQDVARYKCCGFSVNNPSMDSNGAHFFGKRDGVWYYVMVDVK